MSLLSIFGRLRVVGTGWKNIVRSATFSLLLFPALTGDPSRASESTYHLVGTIESKGFTGVVIITPDGQQSFYRLRETLPDGAQLVQVHSDRISVKGPDGSRYEMFISLTAGKLQTAASPGASALTQPDAQSPVDIDQQKRSARRRSQRSSAGEE